MVLQAVGVSESGANQRLDILREYLPFAWDARRSACCAVRSPAERNSHPSD